jgi:Ca-activated chloride channel family protein
MPQGRTGYVRSHRRGGARTRRRVALAPWIITIFALVLVGGSVTAGVAYLVRGGCTGKAEATIVVTPRIESIMEKLDTDWAKTSPSVDGTCAEVTIRSKESSEMATALAGEWDTKTQGTPPDVWVPDASAWVRKASVDADAERIMPDRQPSLARSPTVIAMPKQMAEAAGLTRAPQTWQQIIQRLSRPQGWKAYDHADWGRFKVALSDPQTSTAGLLSLMAISDADDSGDVGESELPTLLDLKRVISLTTGGSTEIIDGLRKAAADDPKKALTYVSAFPALEQDVVAYNLQNPKVPLVAIYPQNGTAEADFPYLMLTADWHSALKEKVATAFLRYIRGPEGKTAFLAEGLRDANRVAGPTLVPANGVEQKVTALPRAILLPESLQHAAASWTAVTRETNVLLVFDTSGSTGLAVPGTGKTRLDLTKAAALNALSLLDETARVGVWEFSRPNANNGADFRKVLPMAPLSKAAGAATQREAVSRAVGNLRPGGNTGLYNTAWAACQEVAARYQPGAANLVLLLTDGADDNNVAGGLSLDQLVRNLRQRCGGGKPVKVITIGLGVDSDSGILRQISAATKAPTFSSPRSFDINQVVLTALFG